VIFEPGGSASRSEALWVHARQRPASGGRGDPGSAIFFPGCQSARKISSDTRFTGKAE